MLIPVECWRLGLNLWCCLRRSLGVNVKGETIPGGCSDEARYLSDACMHGTQPIPQTWVNETVLYCFFDGDQEVAVGV